MIIDFTGTVPGANAVSEFGDEVTKLIRSNQKPHAIAVIDRSVGPLDKPVLVRDHLNFTGWSPLCGPNDPCGERFPVVQGIYIEDALPDLSKVVVAGLKNGVVPNSEEMALIKHLGAQAASYNIVPTMLVAAHSSVKVLAVLLPEGSKLTNETLEQINKLTGEAK